MMEHLLWAVGSVLVFEGLVLALAPLRLAEALALLARLSVEARRVLGLSALALGVGVLWLVRAFFGWTVA